MKDNENKTSVGSEASPRSVAPEQGECSHEWKERGDYDLGGNRSEVICVKCDESGERNNATGEVYYPAS